MHYCCEKHIQVNEQQHGRTCFPHSSDLVIFVQHFPVMGLTQQRPSWRLTQNRRENPIQALKNLIGLDCQVPMVSQLHLPLKAQERIPC